MKIGYFGDGPWAHNALDLIGKREDMELQFVCGRKDRSDIILKRKANNLGLKFFTYSDINNIKVQKKLSQYKCDLFVSMSFNQIFKKEIFEIPKYGTINCHAGKLPMYRGRNILNWVLINDEKEFGITVHFIDEGIDTGDIIMQESFSISDVDNYKTLLEKAYKACPDILLNSILKVKNREVKPLPQSKISDAFMYCSRRKKGDEIIEWNSLSREIFNFIRALTHPGPCARSFLNNQEIKIIKSKLIKNSPTFIGIPGCVLDIHSDGFIVKTNDSYLKILEWESKQPIKRGMRLNKGV